MKRGRELCDALAHPAEPRARDADELPIAGGECDSQGGHTRGSRSRLERAILPGAFPTGVELLWQRVREFGRHDTCEQCGASPSGARLVPGGNPKRCGIRGVEEECAAPEV